MIIEGKEIKEQPVMRKDEMVQARKKTVPVSKLTTSDGTLANAVIRIKELEEALRLNGIVA